MADFTQKQKITTRWGQLKTERASWWMHWQEITAYFLPRNGRYFIQDRDKGWRRHNNIFDNTGTKALETLSAGLMGGLTSPARPWFRLGVADQDLMKNSDVKKWLNDVTTLMLTVFQRSNTYRSLHSAYRELGAFGTSCTLLQEDYRDVIRHYPLTTGEFCIATDWRGDVTTVYREFQKTVSEIAKEFGPENCSPTLKTMYDRGNLDAWVTILHAIEPRADRDITKRDPKNMAWKSVYYEMGGNPDKPLRESGYKSFQALCPRWDVAGGDIYGNSPAMAALGDQKQLQHEQLRKAQGIDYMTKPPLQVPTNMKNRDVETMPGGLSYVDTAHPSGGIKTLYDVKLDLNHLLADIQDVRGRINSAFFADIFLMISQDSANSPRMTATEVAELHEEKMLMLGPVLERLQNELLDPLIEITFQKLLTAGLLPPPPPELQGQDLQVELVSMLAQAQRAIQTNGVDRFVGSLGAIAQFKPDVLDKFDADNWAEIYSDALGVDPTIIVPAKDVAYIRKQRAAQQAQQMQTAQLEQATGAAKNLAQSPTQGGQSNALQDVTKMFSGYTGA